MPFKKPDRILIIRTDRFGEFILNTPAIKAIKAKFPDASITLMLSEAVKEIVSGWPIIDEILVYSPQASGGVLKLALELRKRKFDLAIILNPKKEFHLAVFLAGIPERVGYNRKFGFLLNGKIQDRKHLGEKHEVEYNLDLLRAIGIESPDKSLLVSYGTEDERAVNSLIKEKGILGSDTLIAIHPWTSDSIKQWPLENFLELADKLLKEHSVKIAIIGGKEEASVSEEFCSNAAGLMNLTGKLTLRQLAALLKRCKLLVSNDSGPVHMACAVKTPVIAIFRNDIPGKGPKRWGPWGEGHVVLESANLSDITVESVFEAVKEKLGRL